MVPFVRLIIVTLAFAAPFEPPQSPTVPPRPAAALVALILALYAVEAAPAFAVAERHARLQQRLYRWCCGCYGGRTEFQGLRTGGREP